MKSWRSKVLGAFRLSEMKWRVKNSGLNDQWDDKMEGVSSGGVSSGGRISRCKKIEIRWGNNVCHPFFS